jgi:hypothetical protein
MFTSGEDQKMEQQLDSRAGRDALEGSTADNGAGELDTGDAVALLEEGADRFETPSDLRVAEENEYEDIVAELKDMLADDFNRERSLGQRAINRLTGSESPLVYNPSGFTADVFDSYRNAVWPGDPDIDDFQAGVVAGYLLADSITEAGSRAVREHGVDPVSVQARVNGRTVSPGEPEKLVEKWLYEDPSSFFSHAAVHHFELRRSERVESGLRERANSPGSDGAEERHLTQLFDRFESYSGDLLFKDFAHTYRQQYEDDHPLNWAVEDVLENAGPHPEGVVDGIYGNTR